MLVLACLTLRILIRVICLPTCGPAYSCILHKDRLLCDAIRSSWCGLRRHHHHPRYAKPHHRHHAIVLCRTASHDHIHEHACHKLPSYCSSFYFQPQKRRGRVSKQSHCLVCSPGCFAGCTSQPAHRHRSLRAQGLACRVKSVAWTATHLWIFKLNVWGVLSFVNLKFGKPPLTFDLHGTFSPKMSTFIRKAQVMRRQFADFLLVLRLCSLAAQWLLPTEVRPNCEHLPPLEDPQDLRRGS